MACLALLVVALAALTDHLLGPPPLQWTTAGSATVVDRDGRLLRAFTTPGGRWRLPAEVGDVNPRYLDMLLAFEDRRFRDHPGVDPLSVLRAAGQLVVNRRAVSGASTLTMQVARLVDRRHERTAFGKLRQMARALQLEHMLTKDQILRLYLKLAPFGGNLEGVRAASLAYFGKEPVRLSIAEAALLVALPQSPEARRPDLHPVAARIARDRVLARVEAAGVISPAEAERARAEPVPRARRPFPRIAAHLAETEVAGDREGAIHRLTIDRDFQVALESLAAERVRPLGGRISVAIIAIDNATGEVLAHVGSPGYLDDRRFGMVDMVGAVRSPGSTLKPFIYGLAFEAGLAHPETLIEDLPARFGGYRPRNFDEGYHGTVSIREALQLSLNVPAVKVLDAVGPARLMARLRSVGAEPLLPRYATPSLAMALGGVGMRLSDLATLYCALARGGEAVPLTYRRDAGEAVKAPPVPGRIMAPAAAWYVTDILKGVAAPENARGGRIAYKTGTSYGYRDAWAVGFDGAMTIAVWVGRPSASTPGLTGVSAAAPVLFDAFQRRTRPAQPFRPRPKGVVVASNAELPPPLRRFLPDAASAAAGGAAGVYADPPVSIAFPPDKAQIEVAMGPDGHIRPIVLKAEGGVLPLTWLVDDAPIASEARRREVMFAPAGRGFVKLSVIDARGRVDRVMVRLD
ncbi:MAG: penicillin-binding protein 1C [Hyphomicrobiaceae bacterium]